MDSHEDGEPRLSSLGESHMLIGDSASNLRGLHPLSVIEARTNFELNSIVSPHFQSPKHVGAPPTTLIVASNHSFSIIELLHFEEAVCPSVLIESIGVSDHDSLSLISTNFIHLLNQLLLRLANVVFMQFYHILITLLQSLFQLRQSFLERHLQLRCIKDHIPDVLPLIILVLSPDDTHDLLESIPATPELPVQSHLREGCLEEIWRIKEVPISGVHSFSIPVAAHSIQLLTHVPTCRVDFLWVIILRKHHLDATSS
mmetsp:Transcript_38603/g.36954  ORF Transcript_38603/g.36954 Transcript_38603/m.36954 type:complete len:257 (-) Transcript_38603:680-1450(-)